MGYYRPRPIEVKQCKHCRIPFESRHKRTIYCGESCRQQAYQARQKVKEKSSKKASGDLAFSLQNIGVAATGAAVAAAGNYLLNDQPAQRAILDELKKTQQQVEQLLQTNSLLRDYIDLQLQRDPMLAIELSQKQVVRIEQSQHKEKLKQDMLNKLLAKRDKKRNS
jgi:predicted exporter